MKLLKPFTYLYDYFRRKKIDRTIPALLPLKVICVGNITVGGAGKTPVSIAIHAILKSYYAQVYFLSKGYKGSLKGPVLVSGHDHQAHQVGDEPLLLARQGNTIVSKDRYKGALAAHKAGAQVIIMDDGFQNASIVKHINFLVVDGATGFGNEEMLPAGPLRQPIEEGLGKCDAIILLGTPSTRTQQLLAAVSKPIFKASTQNIMPPSLKVQQNPVKLIAFAGIAFPEKFKKTLLDLNIHIKEFFPFPDHYAYKAADIENLKSIAFKAHMPLVTTEKDFVRLTPQQQQGIIPISLQLVWDNEQALIKFLEKKLCLPLKN